MKNLIIARITQEMMTMAGINKFKLKLIILTTLLQKFTSLNYGSSLSNEQNFTLQYFYFLFVRCRG